MIEFALSTIYIPTEEDLRRVREREKSLFEAWQIVNPQHSSLTIEQWQLLRQNDMLPGVDYDKNRSEEAMEEARSAKRVADQARDAAESARRRVVLGL